MNNSVNPLVEIKLIQTNEDAILPTKAHEEDNCWDIYSVEGKVIPAKGSAVVDVGVRVAYITPGYGFVIRPRSGLGFKFGIQPHLGEFDQTYQGSANIKLYNFSDKDYSVTKGDRIAQFKIEKVWRSTVSWTDTIIESSRGQGGLGSSGK